MRVQLSLSFHYYLLYLLLNSCDRNDAFWHHYVLVKQSISLNTGLHLSRSVSAKQSGWLQNLWTDAGTYVHCTNICPRYRPLWPATWSSASLTHRQAYHKTSSTKQLNSIYLWYKKMEKATEKAVTCKHEGKMTLLWTSAKLKPALFRANTLHNRLFSEPSTIYLENTLFRVISTARIKANKVSKSEGIRKVEYAYHF